MLNYTLGTIEASEALIKDLYIDLRAKVNAWSKITQQTPQARMGYVGQHLVSVVTGYPGGKSGARGYDLVIDDERHGEIKTCYRVDQLGSCNACGAVVLYGDNVFEKDGIRRDRTGDGEKTRCLCGKRGIFNWDGPAMGPQIIRQLERRASRRSASFFHALASPGRPRNGGGASGAYQPAEGRKTLIQGRFRAQEGPLGPSRKSQQQTKRTGFAALEDSIADEAPEGKRAKRANRALNRAGINSRGQKQGFGGADRLGGRVTSR